MATRSKHRRPPKTAKGRPVESPKRRDTRRGRSWWPLAGIAVALAAVAVVAVVLTQRGGNDGGPSAGDLSSDDRQRKFRVAPESPTSGIDRRRVGERQQVWISVRRHNDLICARTISRKVYPYSYAALV